jgi:hypothetical protein
MWSICAGHLIPKTWKAKSATPADSRTRLLGGTLSWLITTITSAAIFTGLVIAVDNLFPQHQRAGVTSAAFVTALPEPGLLTA